MSIDAAKARVTAMCDTCGCVRPCSGRQDRVRLRCTTCGVATSHSRLINADDWRERQNARANPDLFRYVRDLEVVRSMGVTVEERVDPEEGFAEVQWYLDGSWVISLQSCLPIAEKARLLHWAWGFLLPGAAPSQWEGPVLEDELGEFRGIYYAPGPDDLRVRAAFDALVASDR
ncbi:hypothetical protein [Cellulomonas iranensis]|uniref:hypothetical protein n=1 Tax=Cellulomonas iranensis TaxID=76862 RepID=UPI003D7CF101